MLLREEKAREVLKKDGIEEIIHVVIGEYSKWDDEPVEIIFTHEDKSPLVEQIASSCHIIKRGRWRLIKEENYETRWFPFVEHRVIYDESMVYYFPNRKAAKTFFNRRSSRKYKYKKRYVSKEQLAKWDELPF